MDISLSNEIYEIEIEVVTLISEDVTDHHEAVSEEVNSYYTRSTTLCDELNLTDYYDSHG